MKSITCADLVWVATALLSRDEPKRPGFSHGEIRKKVYDIEPHHGLGDSTVRTHIAKHCVANVPPNPLKHRKLYRNPDGTYRLYRPGDAYDPGRKDGKILPKAEQLPSKYRSLLEWYDNPQRASETKPDRDPLLALRGLGKELWKELGGGEKFIREMRENWYGRRTMPDSEKPRKEKRAS